MCKGKALTCWASFFLFTKLLLLLLLLHPYYSCSANQNCAPSSCGKTSNISFPFRLRGGPSYCGNKTYYYNLTCQNNVTVLELFPRLKYHVEAINYNNFTVRLVDPDVQQSNCSTIPRYFLYQGNFSDVSSGLLAPYQATQRRFGGVRLSMFQHIIYFNCTDPVPDNHQYIDTAPCINEHSNGHIYALAGNFLVGSVKAECRVKQVALSSLWGPYEVGNPPTEKNISYREIHMGLAYGFEVSWMLPACQDKCGSDIDICSYDKDFEVVCYPWWCNPYFPKCGWWEKLMGSVLAFFDDIKHGLLDVTDREYWLEPTVGMAAGRHVVPYLGIRFLLGSALLVVVLIYKYRRRHLSVYENIETFLQDNNINPVRYSYRDIKRMTGGFKEKLGEGGFGSVYKGRLRSGPFVAIKMLGKAMTNGHEFISEVATIGRIHHINVVQLVGFCVEGSKRALIYEFMLKGSLDKYIFSKNGTLPLDYEKIYDIALGVARGIAYLHQGCEMQILHFDIKPHNILLDENFIPKISDFGLAKLYPVNDSIATLTAARGTIGYMAPELFYKNIGRVSYKADVYSFGMLLMEMAGKEKEFESSCRAIKPTLLPALDL